MDEKEFIIAEDWPSEDKINFYKSEIKRRYKTSIDNLVKNPNVQKVHIFDENMSREDMNKKLDDLFGW